MLELLFAIFGPVFRAPHPLLPLPRRLFLFVVGQLPNKVIQCPARLPQGGLNFQLIIVLRTILLHTQAPGALIVQSDLPCPQNIALQIIHFYLMLLIIELLFVHFQNCIRPLFVVLFGLIVGAP